VFGPARACGLAGGSAAFRGRQALCGLLPTPPTEGDRIRVLATRHETSISPQRWASRLCAPLRIYDIMVLGGARDAKSG
jgi:phage terminase large subunit-like protein